MTDLLDLLRQRGILTPLDWHFARTIGRLADEPRPLVLLAAALTSRAVGHGHVCLDLRRLAERPVLVDDAGEPVACGFPPPPAWIATLADSPLVAGPDAAGATPLILDARGRVYLRRYWYHQVQLAAAIRERAGVEEGVDDECLRDGLARLFGRGGLAEDETDWQAVAALTAVLRRVSIISGGPGTGKTHTVVRILALLVEQALAAERPPPRIVLLAPTGKAAARLAEAIRAGKEGLPCAPAVVAAIPDNAATIHRALQAVRGHGARFRHDRTRPLLADVVLVDEASMVDLALMDRLVAAVPPAARLILLGDRDQLASVEAGAVLGDLCNSGAPSTISRSFASRLAAFGAAAPAGAEAAGGSALGDCIVQLTRSYRYAHDSGIGRLARAINAGDLDAVEAAFAAGGEVRRVEPTADGTLGPALERLVLEGFAAYIAAADAAAALAALGRFRLLCAHRRGRFGVDTVNAQIEQVLAAAGYLVRGGTWYARRPILVTRNDYQLQLFNGDVGVIWPDPARPGEHRAVFPEAGGGLRAIAPARLPPHETVFAMSIHKSQGSELDEVAVLLPAEPSPVVSRELLYTAITRARRRVTVVTGTAVLAHAVTHRLERASGLRDALWGAAAAASA